MKKQNNVVVNLNNNLSNRAPSVEQYEKLMRTYHHALKYAKQEVKRVKSFLDEAFTKYPNSNSSHRKLKDFEIHESRNYGLKAADNFVDYCDTKIDKIENYAKQQGVEIIKKQESITLGDTEIPIQNVYDKEGNDE
jgi:hypothetical protein